MITNIKQQLKKEFNEIYQCYEQQCTRQHCSMHPEQIVSYYCKSDNHKKKQFYCRKCFDNHDCSSKMRSNIAQIIQADIKLDQSTKNDLIEFINSLREQNFSLAFQKSSLFFKQIKEIINSTKDIINKQITVIKKIESKKIQQFMDAFKKQMKILLKMPNQYRIKLQNIVKSYFNQINNILIDNYQIRGIDIMLPNNSQTSKVVKDIKIKERYSFQLPISNQQQKNSLSFQEKILSSLKLHQERRNTINIQQVQNKNKKKKLRLKTSISQIYKEQSDKKSNTKITLTPKNKVCIKLRKNNQHQKSNRQFKEQKIGKKVDQKKVIEQLQQKINSIKLHQRQVSKPLLNTLLKSKQELISNSNKIRMQSQKINQLRKQISNIQQQFQKKQADLKTATQKKVSSLQNQIMSQSVKLKNHINIILQFQLVKKKYQQTKLQLNQQKERFQKKIRQFQQLQQQRQREMSQKHLIQSQQIKSPQKILQEQRQKSLLLQQKYLLQIEQLTHEVNAQTKMNDLRYSEKCIELQTFQKKFNAIEQNFKQTTYQLDIINSQYRNLKRNYDQRSDQNKLLDKQFQQYKKSKQQDINLMIQNYTKEIEKLQRLLLYSSSKYKQSNSRMVQYSNKIKELQRTLKETKQKLAFKSSQLLRLQKKMNKKIQPRTVEGQHQTQFIVDAIEYLIFDED